MATAIKPIETQYKGYRFRSRLEARWAVFFDALGIEWEYEKEGYDLGGLGWYLPDFWLPHGRMWAEVKPEKFDDVAFEKCGMLVEATQCPVILLEGIPDIKFYGFLFPVPEGYCAETGAGWALDVVFISNYHNYYVREKRFYGSLGSDTPYKEGIVSNEDIFAVQAARSARFEHGETPTFARKERTRGK